MAIKFRGKDFQKLTAKEIQEYLAERIYLKPTATYELNKKGKFVRKKK